ncbi:hypothetical protein QDY65_07445 [Pyrococcus kukulkanii]|uniref:hypothetical protein n=1 Tax=Pyrococcus kukulkanii TaxID=1609559 RepID=UPI0035684E21
MNAKAKVIIFLMIVGGLGGIVVLFNAFETTTEYFFQEWTLECLTRRLQPAFT